MHRASSCLGLCAALFFVAIVHTTYGITLSLRRRLEERPRNVYVPVIQPSPPSPPLPPPPPLPPLPHYGLTLTSHRTSSSCDSPGAFRCHNGECVSIYDVCDAVRDCDDGTDEENCEDATECEERSHGRCKNGRCVYKFGDCTGRDSCGDGSRNVNCTMCRASGYLCPNKRCIHSEERCNGLDACGDGTSDMDCINCTQGAVLIQSTKRCIRSDDVCSGFDIAGDGSTDANCFTCKQGGFRCENRRCIRPELKCTGDDACGDNSNNKNCTRCRNMSHLTADNRCTSPPALPHGHHLPPSDTGHHHFAYGVVIGVFGLLLVVTVSVIALYFLYPSKFRWLHRHAETGLVM